MSRKSPDRRPPCGGWNQPIYYGGCANQRNSKNHAFRLINTTKVHDYASGSSAAIDPYARPEQRTSPNCSPYDQTVFDCGDGENGNPYCGLPDTGSFIYAGNLFPLGEGYYNSYIATTESVDYSYCKVLGAKTVHAQKAWPGRYSYNARIIGAQDEMEWCCSCGTHNLDSTPETTKYLTVSSNVLHHTHNTEWDVETSVNGQHCCPDENGNSVCGDNSCETRGNATETDHIAEVSISQGVDIFGNRKLYGWGGYWTGWAQDDPVGLAFLTDAFLKSGMANGDINVAIGRFCDPTNFNIGQPDIKTTGKGSSLRYEWQTHFDCTDSCGNITDTKTYSHTVYEINLAGGTLDVYTYGIPVLPRCSGDAYCPTVEQSSHEHYSYNGTSMLWIRDVHAFNSVSVDSTDHYEVTGQLSTPYTVQEAEQAAKDLMANWPLDNDILLPWRTTLDKQGPLINYNETQAAPYIDPYFSSSAQYPPIYGEVIGMPGPLGIDRIWNRKHDNKGKCSSPNDVDICHVFYTEDWGAWSDSIGIPHASQWLNKIHAKQVPEGAYIGMNFFQTTPSTCNFDSPPHVFNDDIVRVAKYACVIIPERKSYNFARPCGPDRFQMERTSARCIIDASGSVLTLEPNGEPSDINAGEYIWVAGWDLDGCYKAAGNSGYTVTLGQCVVSASALQSNPILDAGNGFVGKLRWQMLPPGICGRVDILSVSDSSPATCSLAEPTYLTDSDKVIITGARGANINGLWSIKVISPSSIALVGSNGTGNHYSGSTGAAFNPGAADYRWNDTDAKHDYVARQWYLTGRDIGEWQRINGYNLSNDTDCDGNPCPLMTEPAEPRAAQALIGLEQAVYFMPEATSCQAVSACHPFIAGYSPNGETFSNNPNVSGWVNHGFPSITLDGLYSGGKAAWYGIIQQTDNDPLWQAPPCPCSENGSGHFGCYQDPFESLPWREDDGSCEYGAYAHAPQVESRASVPEGAPALPKGVYMGALTPAQIAAGITQGNILNSPFHDANSNISQDPTTALTPIYSYPPYFALYSAMQNCVCFGGAFAEDYAKNGVACN